MENILTPEDKQVLRIISKYLRANGLKEGSIEVDMDYGQFDPESVENYDVFSNSYNVEIPKEFIEIVKKVLVHLEENGAIETPDVDDINYERISISLDAITRQLSIEHYYSYYEPSEEDVTSWSEKDYEDEEENTITQLFDSIKEENPDIKPKNGILTVRYNGSGDSGYMEDYFEEGGSVPSTVEDWCYNQLGNLHAGWEINEGSDGRFVFDTKNGLVELFHTFNNEESQTNTVYEEKF